MERFIGELNVASPTVKGLLNTPGVSELKFIKVLLADNCDWSVRISDLAVPKTKQFKSKQVTNRGNFIFNFQSSNCRATNTKIFESLTRFLLINAPIRSLALTDARSRPA